MMVAVLMGAASILSLGWLFGFGHGTLDPIGRPLGTDFSEVYAAGKMALNGHAADAWSWPKHFAIQRQIHHDADVPVYGWHYPPPFLLIASTLAMLPYLPALIVWQTITLGVFARLMYWLVPRRETLLLVFAAPVTLVCVTHGHNGFLTALLLGAGLALQEEKPFPAGLLLGCLIYKPQFALVIPPLLLATRNWRAIVGAATSATVLIALTFALWGWPVWQSFIESLPLTRQVVIEQGNTGWYKIMSPFAGVRMWGGSIKAAYYVQAFYTLSSIIAVSWVSWRNERPELRNALVCAAAILSTPYVLDYDLVIILPALAWLWIDGCKNGFERWDGTLMALAWATPLIGRSVAEWAFVPLGLISVVGVAWVSFRRCVTALPFRRSREAFAR